ASLAVRLEPYLTRSPLVLPRGPSWAEKAGRFFGDEEELRGLLAAAGREETAAEMRAKQAMSWLAVTGGFALAVVPLRAAGARLAFAGGLAASVLVGAAGPLVMHAHIKAQARARRMAMELELPAVSGLVSVALVAGESLRAALSRAAAGSRGQWHAELER